MVLKNTASLIASSDSDDEHYETVSPYLAGSPIVQQKVKYEQPVAQVRWGHPQGAPDVTEFMTYQPYTQTELVDLGKWFREMQGKTLAAWLL